MNLSGPRRESRSAYMEWAKTRSHARFNLATSGLANFPIAKLRFRLEDLELTSPGGYGYEPLQRRLAAKCEVKPECVVAAAGTSMANHLAMAALIDPGDEVLIEHPTYGLLLDVAEYLSARVCRFPRRFENDFQIDPRELQRVITPRTRLIVITNLHNPSGVFTSESILKEIGDIARKVGAHVLVDEVYLDAYSALAPRSSFHLGETFVVTSSLTKVYGLSGLRCGWILANPPLAERMWRLSDLFAASAAHPAERLSVVALDHLDTIAAHTRSVLETNRALLKNLLDSRKELRAVWPEAGTIVFPLLAISNPNSFFERLRDVYETSVVPGHYFAMPNHFRIGVGGDTEMVAQGLVQLARALDGG
ncbi:MAG TPA: aminotransferase class I/II-fold pyridoxal phosphate-dependent enzyme [Candidatus Dormibacteraeota bacterium]|nr:aminotransferase class I/II-fold pyridoxal phosphate-dependent enzyme [Candidatus Dormibacteraeota bacterium]